MGKNLHCVNFAPAISKTLVKLLLFAVNIKIAVTFAKAKGESSKTKKFSWSQCAKDFLKLQIIIYFFFKFIPVCTNQVGDFVRFLGPSEES